MHGSDLISRIYIENKRVKLLEQEGGEEREYGGRVIRARCIILKATCHYLMVGKGGVFYLMVVEFPWTTGIMFFPLCSP